MDNRNIDKLHLEALQKLKQVNVDILSDYDLNHILFNEVRYAIEFPLKRIIVNFIRRIFTTIDSYNVTGNDDKFVMFSVKWGRADHDEYWKKITEAFPNNILISVDTYGENKLVSKKSTFKESYNKLKDFLRAYKSFNEFCLKQRIYLATRIVEIKCLEQKLISFGFMPEATMCMFDGEYYSNFVMQYYKIHCNAIRFTNQHGQPVFVSHTRDVINQSQLFNFSCDFFLAKGEFCRKQFEKLGVDHNRIKVIGSFDNITQTFSEKGENIAVFLDAPMYSSQANDTLVLLAGEIGKRLGIKPIVKLHPIDLLDYYLKKYEHLNVDFILKEKSLKEVFEQISIGIIHASATYIDIVRSGKRALRYKDSVDFPITENQDYVFSDIDDCIVKIKRWNGISKNDRKCLLNEELKDYIQDTDAREMIIKAIRSK